MWRPEKDPTSPEKIGDFTITIEKALERVKEVYEKNDVIDEKDFKNLYSEERIEADLEYVDKTEKEFEEKSSPEQKEAKKLASIFEAIVYDQGERSNWLGENATTIKSSRYDDIKNGVDIIVEFPDREKVTASHLALAVDVTFSDDLKEKMDRIKNEIRQGKLATVKYFKSDFLNLGGEKTNVPKVIVGADTNTLKEVMELWVAKKENSLAIHPVQFIILEEILDQLDNYREYAKKFNKQEIVKTYDKLIQIVENVYWRKEPLREEVLGSDDSKIKNDKVYSAINKYLEKELFKSRNY